MNAEKWRTEMVIVANLVDSCLSIQEKVTYMRARCLLSALNFAGIDEAEDRKMACDTIKRLNSKMLDAHEMRLMDTEVSPGMHGFLKII